MKAKWTWYYQEKGNPNDEDKWTNKEMNTVKNGIQYEEGE